ncbi:prolyl oligopeptidase family serine peptidase [bacterium]|nr:prolyl oligopeptidase family serine peptidase [bacterium]
MRLNMLWVFPCRQMRTIRVRNPIDGRIQPSYVGLPTSPKGSSSARPMIVFFHKWSSSYREYDIGLAKVALKEGWVFLSPHYRGRNNRPDAGASAIAQQDVCVAIDECVRRFDVDPNRIHLAGLSGGGHMALVMAGRFPSLFASATVWSPIGDLADWHRFHVQQKTFYPYWKDVEAVTGGPPGSSPSVDMQYAERSPVQFFSAAERLPVDINHGIHDGHQGHTIPINQSIQLFNRMAKQTGTLEVSRDEIRYLLDAGQKRTIEPIDHVEDPSYGTRIYLRRQAGRTRLTIFEGAHDMIVSAAYAWLKDRDQDVVTSSNNLR